MTTVTTTLKTYDIREARDADVERIDDLVNSAYRGESSKQGWTTEADILGGQRIDADRLREILRDPAQRILCMTSGTDSEERLRATVCLERVEDEAGRRCYLGMLTVDPKIQAAGLGKIMINEAETYAVRWGATCMTLSVIHVREELMAWYERRGYRRTGETSPFPYGDERFGEPKRGDLYFLHFEKQLG